MVVGGHRERPDRVVLTDGATWVVDFKTGSPMEEHGQQVEAYCQAMRDMGYPEVSGYLVYLQPELMVVEN